MGGVMFGVQNPGLDTLQIINEIVQERRDFVNELQRIDPRINTNKCEDLHNLKEQLSQNYPDVNANTCYQLKFIKEFDLGTKGNRVRDDIIRRIEATTFTDINEFFTSIRNLKSSTNFVQLLNIVKSSLVQDEYRPLEYLKREILSKKLGIELAFPIKGSLAKKRRDEYIINNGLSVAQAEEAIGEMFNSRYGNTLKLNDLYRKLELVGIGLDNKEKNLLGTYLYDLYTELSSQFPSDSKYKNVTIKGNEMFRLAIDGLIEGLATLTNKGIEVKTPLSSINGLKFSVLEIENGNSKNIDSVMGHINEIIVLNDLAYSFSSRFGHNNDTLRVTIGKPVYSSGHEKTEIDILLEVKNDTGIYSIAYEIKTNDETFITKYLEDESKYGNNGTQPANLFNNFNGTLNEYIVVPIYLCSKGYAFNIILEKLQNLETKQKPAIGGKMNIFSNEEAFSSCLAKLLKGIR